MIKNIQNHRIWRGIILVLLVAGIVGPWVFDRINVPAQYTCSAPFVRLEGDYCGSPLSGGWILMAVALQLASVIPGLGTGSTSPEQGLRMIMTSIITLMAILPLFSTFSLLLGRTSKRLVMFHIAALAAAVTACLIFALSAYPKFYWVLWGTWLYFGTALSALIVDFSLLNLNRKSQAD